MLGVAEVDQSIEAGHRLEHDVPALAAVAAVGSAELDELLAPEAHGSGAAGAGAHEDLGLVEEVHGACRLRDGGAEGNLCGYCEDQVPSRAALLLLDLNHISKTNRCDCSATFITYLDAMLEVQVPFQYFGTGHFGSVLDGLFARLFRTRELCALIIDDGHVIGTCARNAELLNWLLRSFHRS